MRMQVSGIFYIEALVWELMMLVLLILSIRAGYAMLLPFNKDRVKILQKVIVPSVLVAALAGLALGIDLRGLFNVYTLTVRLALVAMYFLSLSMIGFVWLHRSSVIVLNMAGLHNVVTIVLKNDRVSTLVTIASELVLIILMIVSSELARAKDKARYLVIVWIAGLCFQLPALVLTAFCYYIAATHARSGAKKHRAVFIEFAKKSALAFLVQLLLVSGTVFVIVFSFTAGYDLPFQSDLIKPGGDMFVYWPTFWIPGLSFYILALMTIWLVQLPLKDATNLHPLLDAKENEFAGS